MEFFSFVVIPLALWFVKYSVDRRYKSRDKEEADAKKELFDKFKNIEDAITKINEVREDDHKINKADNKEIWEHIRTEFEGLKESVGEIRGELKGRNG